MLILSIPFLKADFVKKQSENDRFIWKEYRLDYNQNPASFPLELLNSNSILTIRDVSEGGKNPIPKKLKTQLYQRAIKTSNCLVDYEIQQYEEGDIDPSYLILSYHDMNEITDLEKLTTIIQRMNASKARFLKIAVNINSFSSLHDLCQVTKLCKKPFIMAGMGRLGKLSRLLHKHLGAVGTFVGLVENLTASGQLTESDVCLYNLDRISTKTKLGGIIGGSQVQHSLGLEFYNNYFGQNELDAVYLPFVIDDLTEFNNWFDNCNFIDKFYGFSVTMPFKQAFTQTEPINLFLLHQNVFLNTDKLAFQKTIKNCFIGLTDKILIIGCGGAANTASQIYSILPNVTIACRNAEKGKELAKLTSSVFLPFSKLAGREFDVLINCTPIGMKDEDLVDITGIKSYKKVIDLAYQKNHTRLIDHCLEDDIPFVDGKMFWQWQAETQLAEFVKSITPLEN
jgi:3-dehydroquinate dehydratase / shikimate dehydrogenase